MEGGVKKGAPLMKATKSRAIVNVIHRNHVVHVVAKVAQPTTTTTT